MTHQVVYVGGPRHGDREAREGDVLAAPATLSVPVILGFSDTGVIVGESVYRQQPLADTPGAIAYVHETDRTTTP